MKTDRITLATENNDYGIFVADENKYIKRRDVLVTDLDGSLVKTDLLYEALLSYLKVNIFAIFRILVWLLKGKAELKNRLANKIYLDVERLPYNMDVLSYLKEEKGRYLVLASASPSSFVNAVASHLGIFDEVLSTGCRNLSGRNKADLLVERFGYSGFEYIGNSKEDIPVWNKSKRAVIVSSSPFPTPIARKIKAPMIGSIVHKRPWSVWFRAIRLHQWIKNFLVFLPVLASHKFMEWTSLSAALLAFLAFSLCASSIYIVNDLLDLQEDRKHPTKCRRVFASGELDIPAAAKLFLLLIILTAVVTLFVDTYEFYAVIVSYIAITFAYSLWIKRVMMADVVTLACLYTMRVLAGSMATGIELSVWLLMFSVFMFFGLALLKRSSEFYNSPGHDVQNGRGYQSGDAGIISTLGIGAGLVSILIFILYINDPSAGSLYSNPKLLWAMVPVFLYWLGRIWILAARGEVNCDPVLFVVKDHISMLCGLVGFFIVIMAI